MVKVSNYQEEIIDFSQFKTPEFERCLKYIQNMGKDPKTLFPPIRHKVSFELHETNVELANSIRKCIIDELKIKSMTFDESDLSSDDRYILSDFIRKNIENIPINQDIEYFTAYKQNISISLYKLNTTTDIINIYSHDIVINKISQDGKITKQLRVEDYFAPNVVIISLHPGKYVKVSNIKITDGFTYENAGKFASVANIEYDILDVVPLQYNQYEDNVGKSSLVSNPTKFYISYTTYGNIAPKGIIKLCCDTLRDRLQIIYDELNKVDINKLLYYSDILKIELKDDLLYIYITNEFWSIGRLIAKYGYLEDNNIPFITAGIIHPSVNKCYLKIKHAQPIELLKNAIKMAILDISIINELDSLPTKDAVESKKSNKKGKKETKKKATKESKEEIPKKSTKSTKSKESTKSTKSNESTLKK
jgi:hypothetical protein